MSLIIEAAQYAKVAHHGQYRKISGKPYIVHPADVASKITLAPGHFCCEDNIAIGWLHDTIEDCGTTRDDLVRLFDGDIADAVVGLTSYSKQIKSEASRKKRALMNLDYLADQPLFVQEIKLIDRWSNLESYLDDFSKLDINTIHFLQNVYLPETLDLLEAFPDCCLYAHSNLAKVYEELNGKQV